jgi:hypothetical protein
VEALLVVRERPGVVCGLTRRTRETVDTVKVRTRWRCYRLYVYGGWYAMLLSLVVVDFLTA